MQIMPRSPHANADLRRHRPHNRSLGEKLTFLARRALAHALHPAGRLLLALEASHVDTRMVLLDPSHVFPPQQVLRRPDDVGLATPVGSSPDGLLFLPAAAKGACIAFQLDCTGRLRRSADDPVVRWPVLVERTMHVLGEAWCRRAGHSLHVARADELLAACVGPPALAGLDAGGKAVLMRVLERCAEHARDDSLEALHAIAQRSELADAVFWQSMLWHRRAWVPMEPEDGPSETERVEEFVYRNLAGPDWLRCLEQNAYTPWEECDAHLRGEAAQLVRLATFLGLDIHDLYRKADPLPRSSLALIRDAVAQWSPSSARPFSDECEGLPAGAQAVRLPPGVPAAVLRPLVLELLDRKELVVLGCVIVPMQRMRVRAAAVTPSEEASAADSDDEVESGEEAAENDSDDSDSDSSGGYSEQPAKRRRAARKRPRSSADKAQAERVRALQRAEAKRLKSLPHLSDVLLQTHERLPRFLDNRKVSAVELARKLQSGEVDDLVPIGEAGQSVSDATLMLMTDGAVRFLAEYLQSMDDGGYEPSVITVESAPPSLRHSRRDLIGLIKRLSAPPLERAALDEAERQEAAAVEASNAIGQIEADPIGFFRRWRAEAPIWELLGIKPPAHGGTTMPFASYQSAYRNVVWILKTHQLIEKDWREALFETLNAAMARANP